MQTILKLSFRNLLRNKRRTIIIGVLFLVSVSAILTNIAVKNSISKSMADACRTIFTGDLMVTDKQYTFNLGKAPDSTEHMVSDAPAVARRIEAVPGVKGVLSRLRASVVLHFGKKDTYVQLIGSDIAKGKQYAELSVTKGRLPSGADEVLLSATALKNSGAKLGDKIDIIAGSSAQNVSVREAKIVGILDDNNLKFMRSDTLMVTNEFARKLLSAEKSATELLIYTKKPADAVMQKKLQNALDDDSLKVSLWTTTGKEVSDAMMGLSASIVMLLIVCLFLTFIVTYNMFVMSLNERYREIGTFLALGMKRSHIIIMITLEGAVLGLGVSLLSGAMMYGGINAMGSSGVQIGAQAAQIFGSQKIFPSIELQSLLIALFIGAFGGLAALLSCKNILRVKPVEALTHV